MRQFRPNQNQKQVIPLEQRRNQPGHIRRGGKMAASSMIGAIFLFHLLFVNVGNTVVEASVTCPRLTLSDDFDGSALDTTTWSFHNGNGCAEGICGWGNNELQWYQPENTRLSNGKLVIEAKYDARTNSYTSSKLITKNKADFGPTGRVEARIKIPDGGQGLWPAFWMLPTNEVYGTWARSGEIDIMENVGNEPYTIVGAIHYADVWPRNKHMKRPVLLPPEYNQKFSDSFHTFAIEREESVIRWLLDDVVYFTLTEEDVFPDLWPFDEEFFLILNVAVGGNWPGYPNEDTTFPTQMEVDYVRVWEGSLPTLTGSRVVGFQESGVTYSILNKDVLPEEGTTYRWYVEPLDARIVSYSDGGSTASINFGATGGRVSVTVSNKECGFNRIYEMYVAVRGRTIQDLSILDFDRNSEATYCCSSGTYTANVLSPSSRGLMSPRISPPTRCGRYQRNGSDRWDWLAFSLESPTIMGDVSQYTSGNKIMHFDVFTNNAPIGTEIILTLEDSTRAEQGYPHGRHSRYTAYTTTQQTWERLTFQPLDRPDPSVPDVNSITTVVIQFGHDSLTSTEFYFGNLGSHTVVDSGDGSFVVLPASSNTVEKPAAESPLSQTFDSVPMPQNSPPLPDDADCYENWASEWLCWLIETFPERFAH